MVCIRTPPARFMHARHVASIKDVSIITGRALTRNKIKARPLYQLLCPYLDKKVAAEFSKSDALLMKD